MNDGNPIILEPVKTCLTLLNQNNKIFKENKRNSSLKIGKDIQNLKYIKYTINETNFILVWIFNKLFAIQIDNICKKYHCYFFQRV